MAQYKAAVEYIRPIWAQDNRCFNLYTGRLPRKKYRSEANFHVPYTATLVENVHPLLTGNFPRTATLARNDSDREAAILMNELLDYTFDVNTFDFTFMMTQKASMLYGDGWNKVIWDYQDKATDHASIIPLNSFDVIPHPKKITLDDNFPMFIRAEMTKQEMVEKGWDKNAIRKLGKSKLNTPSWRRQQLQAMGITNVDSQQNEDQPSDDLYEVIEIWGMQDLSFGRDSMATEKMACLVIANGEAIINTDTYFGFKRFESPYSHGKIPLAQLRFNPLPDLLLSESFIDPIASLQEELNGLENMKIDNYKRRNNPPMKVLRSGNVDLSTLKFANSLPWMMETMDDVTPFELPDLASSIENQQDMVRTQMQARSGANDVLLAQDYATIKGGNSATGASIANENSKARFGPQAKLIDLYIERIGEMLVNMYQDPHFFDHDKAIAIADLDGNYSLRTVKPQDVQGDLMFRVESASSLAESNDEKLSKYINLKELYLQDPTVNQDEFDKKIFDAAELDYNKMKKTVSSMVPDVTSKLQQLTAQANDPNFQALNPAAQQTILGLISKLKQMIIQASGGALAGPPGGDNMMSDSQQRVAGPQPVSEVPNG